ncbi:MAG: DNA-binding protein [Acidobacteriota bacterium]|nr:DNA-binding protein [Acidobacteriota bacterium]
MARGGVYRTEVEKARNSLLARGKHPSIDALRVELGNTGSKTTIHRILKEIEAEDEAGVGGKFPISDVLADLVSRLAGQLNSEADSRIAEAKAGFDAQLRERAEQLDRHKKEAADLSAELQTTQNRLHDETSAHAAVRGELAAAQTTIRQLEERVAGLNTRLVEHEKHAESLEEKHRHAREALEHFRSTSKEQREQEQRRHEHQVQGLQVELRQANESLSTKNHELLQLNRENVRLTETQGQMTKDLQHVRGELRARDREIEDLRQTAAEHEALKAHWTEAVHTTDRLRIELEAATKSISEEREARRQAEALSARTGEQFNAIEKLLKDLRQRSPVEATAGDPPAQPSPQASPPNAS